MAPGTRKVVWWASILLLVFLLGFLPSYIRANRLQEQVRAARQEAGLLRLQASIADIHFEASRKNFGFAGEEASRFFNLAMEMLEQTEDPNLRTSLQQVAGHRDEVTAGLAKADPGILDTLQMVYAGTRDAIRQR